MPTINTEQGPIEFPYTPHGQDMYRQAMGNIWQNQASRQAVEGAAQRQAGLDAPTWELKIKGQLPQGAQLPFDQMDQGGQQPPQQMQGMGPGPQQMQGMRPGPQMAGPPAPRQQRPAGQPAGQPSSQWADQMKQRAARLSPGARNQVYQSLLNAAAGGQATRAGIAGGTRPPISAAQTSGALGRLG